MRVASAQSDDARTRVGPEGTLCPQTSELGHRPDLLSSTSLSRVMGTLSITATKGLKPMLLRSSARDLSGLESLAHLAQGTEQLGELLVLGLKT